MRVTGSIIFASKWALFWATHSWSDTCCETSVSRCLEFLYKASHFWLNEPVRLPVLVPRPNKLPHPLYVFAYILPNTLTGSLCGPLIAWPSGFVLSRKLVQCFINTWMLEPSGLAIIKSTADSEALCQSLQRPNCVLFQHLHGIIMFSQLAACTNGAVRDTEISVLLVSKMEGFNKSCNRG